MKIKSEFRKMTLTFALSFMAGMYSLFLLAAFIPFPKGYVLQSIGMALIVMLFSWMNGTVILGALTSIPLGALCAFLYLKIKKSRADLEKPRLRKVKRLFMLAMVGCGMLMLVPLYHVSNLLTFEKKQIWGIDTNKDGKTDKWVHHNTYDQLLQIDYDTDGDGKPDLFEYYDRKQRLIKRCVK